LGLGLGSGVRVRVRVGVGVRVRTLAHIRFDALHHPKVIVHDAAAGVAVVHGEVAWLGSGSG
jgi:hypothetical protein